jgi:hypothetical protein
MVRKVAVAYPGSKMYIALFVYIAPVGIDNPEMCCDMDMVIIVHIIVVSCLRPWITLFIALRIALYFPYYRRLASTLGSSLCVVLRSVILYLSLKKKKSFFYSFFYGKEC